MTSTKLAKPPTIRQVAELAAVSPATVSMVLNKRPCISSAVVDQVMQAVQQLKYQPRRAGRPRVSKLTAAETVGKHPKIVYLFEGAVIDRYVSPDAMYGNIIAGIEDALSQRGVDLILQSVTATHLPVETIGLLGSSHLTLDKLTPLIQGHNYVKMMGEWDLTASYDHITYDNQQVGILVADYCLERQFKAVAVLCCKGIFASRCQALITRLRDNQVQVYATDPVLHSEIYDVPDNFASLLRQFLQAMPALPQALFIPADDLTMLAYQLLLRQGIYPGQDFAIISCNNDESRLVGLSPRPHTVDIQTRLIGRLAAEQLLWRCKHPQDDWMRMKVAPCFIENSR